MKVFTTIVQGWKPLTIAAKNSILNVAGSWVSIASVYKYYSIHFFAEKVPLAASEILK